MTVFVLPLIFPVVEQQFFKEEKGLYYLCLRVVNDCPLIGLHKDFQNLKTNFVQKHSIIYLCLLHFHSDLKIRAVY